MQRDLHEDYLQLILKDGLQFIDTRGGYENILHAHAFDELYQVQRTVNTKKCIPSSKLCNTDVASSRGHIPCQP